MAPGDLQWSGAPEVINAHFHLDIKYVGFLTKEARTKRYWLPDKNSRRALTDT